MAVISDKPRILDPVIEQPTVLSDREERHQGEHNEIAPSDPVYTVTLDLSTTREITLMIGEGMRVRTG